MKHALIISHVGSGATLLCRILSTSLRVRCFGRSKVQYTHPLEIYNARKVIDTKLNLKPNTSDWYIDKLLYNYEFTSSSLYNICKFIYMVRSPQVPLATLISRGYTPEGAETYYLFRLRRMCEMSKKSGGALVTYEDLITKRALPLLQNQLELKSPLSTEFSSLPMDDSNLKSKIILNNPQEPEISIPQDILQRCEHGYNRYLNFMETQTDLFRFLV